MVKRSCALVAAVIITSGCAYTHTLKTNEEALHRNVEDAHQRASWSARAVPWWEDRDEWWVPARSPREDSPPLPPALHEQVVFRRQYAVTLSEVAEFVSSLGVPIVVTADAIEAARSVTGTDTIDMPSTGDSAQVGGRSGASEATAGRIRVSYAGPLHGLLDLVTARTDTHWRWDGSKVVIYHVEQRTFIVHAVPGQSVVRAAISNRARGGQAQQGGGGGGGAGGQQNGVSQASIEAGSTMESTTDTTIDVLAEVERTIKGMLSPKGTMIMGAAGTVVVTDRPYVLDKIGTYLAQLNSRLTAQVVIDVEVYAIELGRQNQLGVDWSAVWRSMSEGVRATVRSPGVGVPDGQQINVSVIDPGSPWADTNLIISALSRQGRVGLVTRATVATLSGQPVPVQIAEETTYLAEASVTQVPQAGTQVQLRPGTVTTGYSLTVIPYVIDRRWVLMQTQVTLSSLRSIRTIGTGDLRIETPSVDSRQTIQRVRVPAGGTLLLTGYVSDRASSEVRGTGAPNWLGFGGRRDQQQTRTELVILVTPRIVSG